MCKCLCVRVPHFEMSLYQDQQALHKRSEYGSLVSFTFALSCASIYLFLKENCIYLFFFPLCSSLVNQIHLKLAICETNKK